jgi:hypothetical protein
MVGGDQMDGLAQLQAVLMVLIVLGGVALFALAGRALARKSTPPRRRLVSALMGLAGAGLAWILVLWTFYPASWSPPTRLRLAIAPGFDAPVVILLEDPRASQAVAWRGGALPFTAATAQISVPPSGIARIRSFGPMAERLYADVTWSDGRQGFTLGGGNVGPPGTGANAYLIIEPPDTRPGVYPVGAPQPSDPPAVAAYVEQRERRR